MKGYHYIKKKGRRLIEVFNEKLGTALVDTRNIIDLALGKCDIVDWITCLEIIVVVAA